MFAPIRLVRGRWPRAITGPLGRFVWGDPRSIVDPEVSADDFKVAMSAIHVGGTIKITGKDRHPQADALLTDNLDLRDALIVDIGASDGSTSADLIEKIGDFRAFVIADLFFTIKARQALGHTLFFDEQGECILVVGNWLLAWPSQSKVVRALYRPLIARATRPASPESDVLLLNPRVRQRMAEDPRVSYRVHDVFATWAGDPPNVIKVANLLRRLYFSDSDITRGLAAIHDSLADGGHFLIVDNPRIKDMPPRGGLYRKTASGFTTVACTENLPEIDDLILQLQVADHDSAPPG